MRLRDLSPFRKTDAPPLEVSVGILAQLVRYLNYLKVDVDMLLLSLGLDPALLSSPDERIPFETYIAIEDEAARVTGDPYFGLHMGEFVEAGNWNILGFMMLNCRTLGEAFEKSGRYEKIIGNLIEGSVQFRGKTVKMVLSTPAHAPSMSRHCFECVVSSSVTMARYLTGKDISPVEVGFTSPEPASREEYQRVLRCPVLFDRKQCYMVLDTSLASIPLRLPNPALLEHFENYAREYLATLEDVQPITREATKLILLHLDSKSLSVATIARKLAMSTRALQNHLRREGTEFSQLLQETRLQLARKHLQDNRTVEEITYLLGFTDSSVFRRFFKKCTGHTPKEYREAASR